MSYQNPIAHFKGRTRAFAYSNGTFAYFQYVPLTLFIRDLWKGAEGVASGGCGIGGGYGRRMDMTNAD